MQGIPGGIWAEHMSSYSDKIATRKSSFFEKKLYVGGQSLLKDRLEHYNQEINKQYNKTRWPRFPIHPLKMQLVLWMEHIF